jgi:uncharacterized membrane protein YfcA
MSPRYTIIVGIIVVYGFLFLRKTPKKKATDSESSTFIMKKTLFGTIPVITGKKFKFSIFSLLYLGVILAIIFFGAYLGSHR